MEWSIFITSVLVLYGLWYGGNYLKDTVDSSRPSGPSEGKFYDISGLQSEDKPVEVKDITVPGPDQPELALKNNIPKAAVPKLPEEQVTLLKNPGKTQDAPGSASKVRLS